jgi:hypothetical protein
MYPAMETVELVFGPESESDAKMSDVKSNVPPKPTAEAAPPKAKTAAKKPVAPAPPTQSNVPPKPTAEAAPPKATTLAEKPVAPAPPTQVGAEKKTTKRRFLLECPKFGPVDEGKLPLQYTARKNQGNRVHGSSTSLVPACCDLQKDIFAGAGLQSFQTV